MRGDTLSHGRPSSSLANVGASSWLSRILGGIGPLVKRCVTGIYGLMRNHFPLSTAGGQCWIQWPRRGWLGTRAGQLQSVCDWLYCIIIRWCGWLYCVIIRWYDWLYCVIIHWCGWLYCDWLYCVVIHWCGWLYCVIIHWYDWLYCDWPHCVIIHWCGWLYCVIIAGGQCWIQWPGREELVLVRCSRWDASSLCATSSSVRFGWRT